MNKQFLIGAALLAFVAAPQFAIAAETTPAPQHKTATHKAAHKKTHTKKATAKKTTHKKTAHKKAAPAAQ